MTTTFAVGDKVQYNGMSDDKPLIGTVNAIDVEGLPTRIFWGEGHIWNTLHWQRNWASFLTKLQPKPVFPPMTLAPGDEVSWLWSTSGGRHYGTVLLGRDGDQGVRVQEGAYEQVLTANNCTELRKEDYEAYAIGDEVSWQWSTGETCHATVFKDEGRNLHVRQTPHGGYQLDKAYYIITKEQKAKTVTPSLPSSTNSSPFKPGDRVQWSWPAKPNGVIMGTVTGNYSFGEFPGICVDGPDWTDSTRTIPYWLGLKDYKITLCSSVEEETKPILQVGDTVSFKVSNDPQLFYGKVLHIFSERNVIKVLVPDNHVVFLDTEKAEVTKIEGPAAPLTTMEATSVPRKKGKGILHYTAEELVTQLGLPPDTRITAIGTSDLLNIKLFVEAEGLPTCYAEHIPESVTPIYESITTTELRFKEWRRKKA